MKIKTNRSAFTIVELVIVIAVIAILAAVLMPTFSGVIQKANASSDIQMVKNLNTTLKTDETLYGVPANMYVALSFAEAGGYSTDKIEAKASGNLILWDSVNNYFCYLNSGEMVYPGADDDIATPSSDRYWALVDEIDPECEYSQYLRSTSLSGEVTVKKAGFDAGNNTVLSSVIVNNATNASINIRTNGGNLNIIAPNADVYVGGSANTVTVDKAASSSVHIGEAFIKELVMNDSTGHVEIESGAVISRLEANAGDIDIESGSTVGYLEANAGTIEVADAGCVTQYYSASDNLVSGSAGTKVSAKVDKVASCAEHKEVTKEVGGNKVTYCSVCGDIISVERIGGGATTSGGDSGSTTKHPTSITLSGEDKVNVGSKITLTATVLPSDAENKNVEWTSTNTSVATVDENGVVTGVADGDATITASSQDPSTPGVAASKVITVIDPSKPTPETITVSGTASIEIGKTTQLTATVGPDGASQNVGWTSSDTNIATVDSTGKVMGAGAGEVTITATSKVAGTVKGTIKITVTKPAPTSVAVTSSTTSVIVGGTLKLNANVLPAAADQSVTWTSADTNIATVNNGTVTGVAAGTVKITATSTNSVKGELEITVVAEPTGITISGDSNVLVGNSITLTATVLPNDTVKTVTWTSSDTSVATVDANGKVTAKKAGSTTITATTVNGKTDTKVITVTAPDPTSISISGDSSVVVGSTLTLKATVLPTGANQDVNWTSSDTSIATVDSNGKVTAKKTGTTTITATSVDKNTISETRKITVSSAAVNATQFGGKDYQWGDSNNPLELTKGGGSSGNIKYYVLKAGNTSYNNGRYVITKFDISDDYVYVDLNGQTIVERDDGDEYFMNITGSHVTITNGKIVAAKNGINVEGIDVTIDCDVVTNVNLQYTETDGEYTLTSANFDKANYDSDTARIFAVRVGDGGGVYSATISGGSYKVNHVSNMKYNFTTGNGDTYDGCYSVCVREYSSLAITDGTFSDPIITTGFGKKGDNEDYISRKSTLTITGGDFGTGTKVYLGTSTGSATIGSTTYYHGSNINNVFTVNGSAALGITTGRSVYTLTGSGSNINYTKD